MIAVQFRRVLLGLLALSCGGPALGQDLTPRHTMAFGVFASQGDYGESDETTMLAAPISYKLGYGYWNLRVATAWVRIEGPGTVDLASVSAGNVTRTQAETGFGDVFASASRVFPVRALSAWWEPYVKVKIPTADEGKGLGTGEMDRELGSEFSRRSGRVSNGFAKVFYRWRGDPADLALDNGLGATVGLMQSLWPDWNMGLMLDYRTAVTATSAPAREITLFGTRKLSAQRSVTFYILGGLSDASPDVGGGVQFQLVRQ